MYIYIYYNVHDDRRHLHGIHNEYHIVDHRIVVVREYHRLARIPFEDATGYRQLVCRHYESGDGSVLVRRVVAECHIRCRN